MINGKKFPTKINLPSPWFHENFLHEIVKLFREIKILQQIFMIEVLSHKRAHFDAHDIDVLINPSKFKNHVAKNAP